MSDIIAVCTLDVYEDTTVMSTEYTAVWLRSVLVADTSPLALKTNPFILLTSYVFYHIIPGICTGFSFWGHVLAAGVVK